MKYRMIDAQNTVVSEEHYPNVAKILEAEGWTPIPAKTEQGIFINLRPQEARESIQVLKDIAPWIIAGIDVWGSGKPEKDVVTKIVVEQEPAQELGKRFKPKTWLHLIYDGKGRVTERETPTGQWEI